MNYKPSSVPLEPGDIIAVAYNNHFSVGIFVRYGGAGNVHFYPMSYIASIAANIEMHPKNLPNVWYINTNADERVVKLTEASLTDKQKEEADIVRKLLLKLGKIK